MRALAFLLPLALAACATRPLTEAERAFSDTVLGPAVATEEVRVVKGAVVGLIDATVPPRPRTTCREKLFPPRDEPVRGVFPVFVMADRMYFIRDAWAEDLMAGYPEALTLVEAMRLAHELTHVWQWQNRKLTGYHPALAAFEHIEQDDPYLIDIDPSRAFLDYGWEQQGILVEEYVCCRALDPDGARTADLRRTLEPMFPGIRPTEAVAQSAIRLPWDGAETRGICS